MLGLKHAVDTYMVKHVTPRPRGVDDSTLMQLKHWLSSARLQSQGISLDTLGLSRIVVS